MSKQIQLFDKVEVLVKKQNTKELKFLAKQLKLKEHQVINLLIENYAGDLFANYEG